MLAKRSPIGWVVAAVGAAMSLYHLEIAFFGPPDTLTLRLVHVGFALTLAYLTLPAKSGKVSGGPDWLSWMLLAVSLTVVAYPIVQMDYIDNRMIYVDPLRTADWIMGPALMIVLLEATRRSVGLALPLTAAVFFAYAVLFTDVRMDVLMEQMYLGTEGIFGIPAGVSATYVMLFILFGSLVERTGTGKLFMDFAMSLTGHQAGGPAKVACITSGMFGTVSGSAVANVMTTGTFTIPLMKKIGYKPPFAGAVEAVASTGGQIMPPIMGAAAFVMAEFLGISYITVAGYALLPAVLYFLAIFMSVHFEAKRTGMTGLPKADLPRMKDVLTERGHLFIPLVVIVGVLLAGYSAPFAALCGIGSVIPTALLRQSTRQYIRLENILEALVEGARNTVSVALACACAGIVIGVITLTGLGISFTTLVLVAAKSNVVLALMLTMVAGIILGMGMPTTPAYIVQVALLVPALVKLGVVLEAAHMFVFYFAILSAITPPVAMAVYAANGLSGAGLWDTGVAAMKLGATGYIVPYMFVFGPSLLLIGEPGTIAVTAFTGILGVICLSAGFFGYLAAPASWWQRIVLVGSAIFLIKPGLLTDAIGIGGVALVFASQMIFQRARRAHTA